MLNTGQFTPKYNNHQYLLMYTWIWNYMYICTLVVEIGVEMLNFCFQIVKLASVRNAHSNLFSWKSYSFKMAHILSVTIKLHIKPVDQLSFFNDTKSEQRSRQELFNECFVCPIYLNARFFCRSRTREPRNHSLTCVDL